MCPLRRSTLHIDHFRVFLRRSLISAFATGILPHDGKNIKFTEMNLSASLFQLRSPNQFDHTHQHKIRTTYNFAPTFCLFVPNYAAQYLKKSYSKDTFNLQDLDLHNAIEHDGSLVR